MDLGEFFDSSFGGFSISSLIDKLYFYVGIVMLAIVIGGVGFAIYQFRKKEKSGQGKKTIIWWNESASGNLEQREQQKVEELSVPGTRLKIFYDKKKDEYLPRFTREVKKDCYYGLRTPTGNIVNWQPGNLSKDFKETDLKHDHTDMIWAAENAREFIKRNYRDKSQKWWQVYQGPLTTAIYLFVMTFSFVIIIYFLRGAFQDLGSVASTMQKAAELCQVNAPSGLASP